MYIYSNLPVNVIVRLPHPHILINKYYIYIYIYIHVRQVPEY